MLNLFTVAFFGHRNIDNIYNVEEVLYKYIKELTSKKEYIEFLVGRNGDFDRCVASSIRRVKKSGRDYNNALVLVLPYLTAEYKNNEQSFESFYDNIEICHKSERAHPKAAIQIRNREMVDRADLIICYISEKCGGAYKTIEYAKKQNKKIINIGVLKL